MPLFILYPIEFTSNARTLKFYSSAFCLTQHAHRPVASRSFLSLIFHTKKHFEILLEQCMKNDEGHVVCVMV